MNATYALTLASTKMPFRNWSSLIFTFMLPMPILFGAGFLSQGGAPTIGVGVVAAHPGAATTRLIAGLHGSQALLVRHGPWSS